MRRVEVLLRDKRQRGTGRKLCQTFQVVLSRTLILRRPLDGLHFIEMHCGCNRSVNRVILGFYAARDLWQPCQAWFFF